MTDDLVARLTAQLDRDEAVAIAAMSDIHDTVWTVDTHAGDEYNYGVVRDETQTIARCGIEGLDDAEHRAAHIALHDPARVLREIVAKRDLIAEWQERSKNLGAYPTMDVGIADGLELAIRYLAAVYADRPGYDESWKP